MTSTDDGPELWSGERVARWLRRSAGIERQLQPVSDVLFAAARLRTGDSVLDVGCGTGPTTLAAAEAVGTTGRVVGVDVSREMLDAAATNLAAVGGERADVEWVEADVASWTWSGRPHDVVMSRFGVMFFADPPAAFTNLARATTAGGRLAMAVWCRRDDSQVFAVPLAAAVDALRARGVRTTGDGVDLDEFLAVDDDGPFSMHDQESMVALLGGSGWDEVAVQRHSLPLPLGGGLGPAAAAELTLDVGPTRVLLTGHAPDVVEAAERSIADALATRVDADGHVVLSGSVNVVTARRVS